MRTFRRIISTISGLRTGASCAPATKLALGKVGAPNRAFTLCRDAPPCRAPELGRAPLRRSHQFGRASLRGPRRRAGPMIVVSPRSVAGASRVPLRRRAPELVTSPPGSPAHAQSLPSRLPPRRPAPALIPGRVAAIAPGRPAPVGTPRRGNFLLLYTSGRGAAFRRGQGVVNAPRCATSWVTLDAPFLNESGCSAMCP